jgi:PhnB protein
MTTVNVYLTFNGNCEEAFNFYKSVLGGDFSYLGRYSTMPDQEGMPPLTEEMRNLIMHIGLPVSAETILMGCDTVETWGAGFKPGNNFAVSINTDSKEKADELFFGLSQGGKVTMPMDFTFWGDYFGMFEDKFGVNWMIGFAPAPQD